MISNNTTHICNNKDIYGNNNTITGNNNDIYGNNNIITGNNNDIRGNSNNITGNNNDAFGNDNKMKGNNNDCHGIRNTNSKSSSSHNSIIVGNGVTIMGNGYSSNSISVSNGRVVVNGRDVTKYTGGGSIYRENVRDSIYVNTKPKKIKEKKKVKKIKIPDKSELQHDKEVPENDDNSSVCAICITNKPITIVNPCNHICLCVECARNLAIDSNTKQVKNRGQVECPICKTSIKKISRVYHN